MHIGKLPETSDRGHIWLNFSRRISMYLGSQAPGEIAAFVEGYSLGTGDGFINEISAHLSSKGYTAPNFTVITLPNYGWRGQLSHRSAEESITWVGAFKKSVEELYGSI